MMAIAALHRAWLRNSTAVAAAAFTSPSTAAWGSKCRGLAGLADFFDSADLHNKDAPVSFGRSWKASELRLKTWEDLHKLWYVLLKEKNVILTQRRTAIQFQRVMPHPERSQKVRKSMCRIKHVLTERALQETDLKKRKEMRRIIDAL